MLIAVHGAETPALIVESVTDQTSGKKDMIYS